jgi:hypothetical protein
MPAADNFTITISSSSALITGQIRFVVEGAAYQFWDSSVSTQAGSTVQEKGSIWKGTFDATGSPAPEPASMFSFGGGALLIALSLRRRRRSPGPQGS